MKPSDFPATYKLWQHAGLKLRARKKEKKEAIAMIKRNKSACFVAEDKGEIVGSVFGAFNGRRGWIYHLVTHPKYQKKGYGSMLLRRAEEALRRLGATKILLGVWLSDKKVLNFYQKRGYNIMDDSYVLVKDLWMD